MNKQITGVILAGGKSRRFQGINKAFMQLGNKSLVEYVIENLQRQVSSILVICNQDQDKYHQFGLPTLADDEQDGGPLQGVVTALHHIETPFALFTPCDVPFFPQLSQVMFEEISLNGKIACILRDHKGLQPTFSLLHRSSRTHLADCLQQRRYKLQTCLQELDHCFYDYAPKAMELFNINTPQDLERMAKHVS